MMLFGFLLRKLRKPIVAALIASMIGTMLPGYNRAVNAESVQDEQAAALFESLLDPPTVTAGVYGQSPAKPVLSALPPLTNQPTQTIAGTTTAGATVTVQVYSNNGGPITAGDTLADGQGQFALPVRIGAEGSYEFRAVAALNGLQSPVSDPVKTTLDITPPKEPVSGEWTSAAFNEVTLRWEKPASGEAPHEYAVFRNGIEIGTAAEEFYQDTNLAEQSLNNYDIYTKDAAGNLSVQSLNVLAGTTDRISVLLAGQPEYTDIGNPLISGDGSTIAFKTEKVDGYTFHFRDASTKQTEVLELPDGTSVLGPGALSGDGRILAFAAQTASAYSELFVKNRTTGSLESVTHGRAAGSPSISSDGQTLLFPTHERLVPEDTDDYEDIYVYRIGEHSFVRLNLGSWGDPNALRTIPSSMISGDGKWAVYSITVPDAPANSGNAYLIHVETGQTVDLGEGILQPGVSSDGRVVVYRNGSLQQIEIYDRTSGSKKTIHSGSPFGDAVIDAQGTHVVYSTMDGATGRHSLYWYDVQSGQSEEIGNPALQETDYDLIDNGTKVVYFSEDASRTDGSYGIYLACPATCNDTPPPDGQPIISVSWEASAMLQRQAELGSTLTVKLIGAKGNTAKAAITYNRYLPDGQTVEPKQEVIPLAESAAAPGQYAGVFELIEGIREVTAITVEVVDSKGHTSSRALDRLPLQVSGGLNVMLEGDGAELNGARIVAWSDSKLTGNQAPYTGTNPVSFKLPDANDYRITLLNARGQLLSEVGPVTVRNGQMQEYPLGLRIPASLSLRVINEQGAGITGAALKLNDPNDGKVIAATVTDSSGNAVFSTGFVGDVVLLTVIPHAPYMPVSVERQLVLERSGTAEIQVEARKGKLTGTVRDEQGQPVPNAIVTLTQPGFTVTAATGTDGTYEMDAVFGRSVIDAMQTELPFLRSRGTDYVDVVSGSVTKDLVLYRKANGRIDIDLLTKNIGGDWRKVDWSSYLWMQYRISLKDADNKPKSFDMLSNAISFQASPGETLQVCATAIWDDFNPVCTNVTLDEQRNGKGELRLMEKSAVTGKVVFDPGKVFKADAVVYELGAYGKRLGGGRTYSNLNGEFTFHLPKAGTYQIEWIAYTTPDLNKFVRSYQQVELPPEQIVQLGELVLNPAGVFTHGIGNQLTALTQEVQENADLSLRGSYRNESDQPVAGAELLLHIPGGTELIGNSVTLNGQPVEAVRQSDAVYRVAVGDIPAKTGGTVTYRLHTGEGIGDYIRPEVRIRYTPNGTAAAAEETVGSVLIRVVTVTLLAPAVTQEMSFRVSGRAPAGSHVLVYDGAELLGEALTSPGGYWTREVTIRSMPFYSKHLLTARALAGDKELRSGEKYVKYDAGQPVPVELTVEQGQSGKVTVDVSEGAVRFPFAVGQHDPMIFGLKFDKPEKVDSVRLHAGGEELPMTLNTVTNTFSAVRMPVKSRLAGLISVDYTVKPDSYAYPDLTLDEWSKTLPEPIQKLKVDIRKDTAAVKPMTAGADTGTVVLPTAVVTSDEYPDMKAEVSISAAPVPNYIPYPLPPDHPWVYNLKTGRRLLSDGSMEMTVSAVVPRESAVRLLGAEALSALSTEQFTDISIKTNIGNYYDLYDTIKSAFEYKDKMNEIEQFLKGAENTGCMPEGRMKYYADAAVHLADHALSNLVWNYTGTLASIALAASGFGIVMGVVVGAVTFGISYLQQQEYEKEFNKFREELKADQAVAAENPDCKKDPDIPSPQYPQEPRDPDDPGTDPYWPYQPVAIPVWIYDPSGYVFEGVPSNRVRDVKATVTRQDPADGTWSVWDADWYGQQNPQMTNKEGRYGWDVPEGKWQVLFEKEGYETAHSDVLSVLPPHFDVNIPIVSREAPRVANIYPVENGTNLQIDFSKYMIPATIAEGAVTVTHTVYAGSAEERIPVKVEPVQPEKDLTGRELARTYRIVPDGTAFNPGETVQVHISPTVFSYAQVPMTAPYEQTVVLSGDSPAPREAVRDIVLIPGKGSIGLTWSEAEDADFDHILVYTDDAVTGPVRVEKGTLVYGADGLAEQTGHTFRLVTVNRYGKESEGVTVTGQTLPKPVRTPDTEPPQEVTGLSAQTDNDKLTLVWTDPDDRDLAGINLYLRKEGEAAYGEPVRVGWGVGSRIWTGLAAGRYEAKVTAVDLTGNESAGSTVTADIGPGETPDTTPPHEVGQPSAQVDHNRLTLTWTDPSDADLKQINLYLRKPGEPEYGEPVAVGKSVQTYTWTDLAQGAYAIRLTTVDTTGNESAGVELSAEIPAMAVITVNADEQSYDVFDRQLNLRIQAGSVPAGTKITVYREAGGKPPYTPPLHLLLKSPVYTLESGVDPGKHVRLTLNYDKDGLKGSDHRKLGIYRYDPSAPNHWEYVGGTVNPGKGEIRADLTEWGTYAVMMGEID